MVVPNSSPAHSVKEFIAYAKANRGRITYASGGHGSSLHLAGELFKRMTGIEMTHVPYRGAAPAFNDLIPGRVDVMFNLISSSLPLARSGQIRALAVATLQRDDANRICGVIDSVRRFVILLKCNVFRVSGLSTVGRFRNESGT